MDLCRFTNFHDSILETELPAFSIENNLLPVLGVVSGMPRH